MNGKFALALILTLQVSWSLCDVPAPSQELVDKYEGMKSVFYRRLLNAYGKLQAALAPAVQRLGEHDQSQAAREAVEGLQTNPHFQSIVKISTGLAQEAVPLVDRARQGALGVYGHYLRPYVGTTLDEAIKHVKILLDAFLPAV